MGFNTTMNKVKPCPINCVKHIPKTYSKIKKIDLFELLPIFNVNRPKWSSRFDHNFHFESNSGPQKNLLYLPYLKDTPLNREIISSFGRFPRATIEDILFFKSEVT